MKDLKWKWAGVSGIIKARRADKAGAARCSIRAVAYTGQVLAAR